MAYIYQADMWCDACGRAIRARLHDEGKVPSYPDREYTYDSGEYPKRANDHDEADTPQHCAAEKDCLNALTLANGHKVGLLFGELTRNGVEYVKEAIAEGGEVAALWKEHYADYL